MKVTAFLRKSVKKNDTDTKAAIYFRLRDKNKDIKAVSELSINPNHWSPEKQGYKDRVALISDDEKIKLKDDIQDIISIVTNNYTEDSDAEWLSEIIDKYHHPKKYKTQEQIGAESKPTFEQLFDEFLLKHKLSDVRKKNFKVIKRILLRYELYTRQTQRGKEDFFLDIENITTDILYDLWNFMENECHYYKVYPIIYNQIPEKRAPKPRGENTLIDYFCKLRTFILWCVETKEVTTNNPFKKFSIPEPIYGTPYYINIDERNKIFDLDLSDNPYLEAQRDIFIFQSSIGCRVGDLYRMTSKNVINGAIEYIAGKTKDGNPKTLRVPLNEKASSILEKYKDCKPKLLPFVLEQNYNEAIKDVFKLAGVDRLVTILNPTTREEEKISICDIASSHLARRTFIGNIYKQVKDPNLICPLSGHKEGSKAFNRYREIDEDMKKELVNLLD